MERVNFEPSYIILEEKGAESEVGVWDDSCVAGALDYASFDGHVVQESKLRVGFCERGGEVIHVEIHDQS